MREDELATQDAERFAQLKDIIDNIKNLQEQPKNIERSKKDKQITQEEIYEKRGITKRFMHCTLDNYEIVDDFDKDIVAYLKEYVHTKNRNNIIFHGKTGNGKTHLACALVKKIPNSLIVGFFDLFISKYGDVLANRNDNTRENFFNYYANKSLLVIDEVEKKNTTASKEFLFQIINRRYENMLPTILIANFEKAGELNTILNPQGCRRLLNAKTFKFDKENYDQRGKAIDILE